MPGGLPLGIDARAAAEVPAGRGRYVRELLRALELLPEARDERFVLYARQPWGELDPARFRWRLLDRPDPLWNVEAAVRANRETRAFLSTNSYLTAWFLRVPAAVVVYDLVPFIAETQAQRRATCIERATIRPALRRARALLCISSATREDLVRLFPRTRGRTEVIPLAADAAFATAAGGVLPPDIPTPYVLAVGTLEPRKNLGRLLDAWGLLPAQLRNGHRLVLVGPRGWDDDAIVTKATAADAIVTGRVDETVLRALYAGAAAFVYPSLYEGFGLPPLEAMASGVPVVTSTVSSLPEVVADAALTVDPRDAEAIANALASILTDPALAARLSDAGRRRAADFSWERTASETLTVLRRRGGRTR